MRPSFHWDIRAYRVSARYHCLGTGSDSNRLGLHFTGQRTRNMHIYLGAWTLKYTSSFKIETLLSFDLEML